MCARICTWEYVTTFDGQPSETQILKLFAADFPQLDLGHVFLVPMISFNSVGGRKLRFLVMVLDEAELPAQIWMFGWADEYLRRRTNDVYGDCDGNGVFWKVENGILYILVFLEGRLCHWSEENGYEGSENEIQKFVNQRIERFRKFLRGDDLFSRVAHYPEIEIGGPFTKPLFKRAARDSFWKSVDLRKGKSKGKKKVLRRLALVALLGFFVVVMQKNLGVASDDCSEIPDDFPLVELSAPPLFESTEERNVFQVVSRKKVHCHLPNLKLRGIVAPQLFMAENQPSLKMETYRMGDSLDDFVVSEIRRSQVSLVCGDSTILLSAE